MIDASRESRVVSGLRHFGPGAAAVRGPVFPWKCFSGTVAGIGVSMNPGATAFTQRPLGPSLQLQALVEPITPNLLGLAEIAVDADHRTGVQDRIAALRQSSPGSLSGQRFMSCMPWRNKPGTILA